jgi:hypothetical protein
MRSSKVMLPRLDMLDSRLYGEKITERWEFGVPLSSDELDQ